MIRDMSLKLDRVVDDVIAEVQSTQRNHAPMASHHEAYSVILEEVDEYWDLVKLKPAKRSPEALREELRQVAATAIRTLHDLC